METEKILAAIQKAADTIATPNWADKWAVILSALAIIAATTVAFQQVKIQEQQNKIALFEERFSTYNIVKDVLSLTDNFDFLGNLTLKEYYVGVILSLNYPEPNNSKSMVFQYYKEMNKTALIIQRVPFLFPKVLQKDANDISEKFRRLFSRLVTLDSEEQQKKVNEFFDNDLTDFIEVSKHFSNKYLNVMERYLNL